MSTDEPKRPFSITEVAEDLTLSNDEGTSWFGYKLSDDGQSVMVEEYGDEGAIVARYSFTIDITKEQ